jgi:hypothetical protein
MTSWSEGLVAPIYLTAADVAAVAHYGHIIPVSRGWTTEFMRANFSGWDWNAIIPVLRRRGAMAARKGHGGALREPYVGVLIHADGRIVLDDGTLTHPAKTAHKPLIPIRHD